MGGTGFEGELGEEAAILVQAIEMTPLGSGFATSSVLWMGAVLGGNVSEGVSLGMRAVGGGPGGGKELVVAVAPGAQGGAELGVVDHVGVGAGEQGPVVGQGGGGGGLSLGVVDIGEGEAVGIGRGV